MKKRTQIKSIYASPEDTKGNLSNEVLFFLPESETLQILKGMKNKQMQAFPLEGKANRKVNI
jgi:hypothetical protein